MSKGIIRDQTFTFDGVNYRAGRPIPEDVARKHGLIREGNPSQEDNSDGNAPDVDSGEGTLLPEDFPARDLLTEAGFETVEDVRSASDEELGAVEGVGPVTLDDVLAAAHANE